MYFHFKISQQNFTHIFPLKKNPPKYLLSLKKKMTVLIKRRVLLLQILRRRLLFGKKKAKKKKILGSINIYRMMMTMMNFCGIIDRRKAFSLISSRYHFQRSSPSRISDTRRARFEPAQNLSSGEFYTMVQDLLIFDSE